MELIINKPYIKRVDNKSRLCADIDDGGGGVLFLFTN